MIKNGCTRDVIFRANRWTDIKKISTNKRTLAIETCVISKAVTFTLDDSDTARYVHRMCHLQRQFFEWMNTAHADAAAAAASVDDAAQAATADAGAGGVKSIATSTNSVHRAPSAASKRHSQAVGSIGKCQAILLVSSCCYMYVYNVHV